MILRPQWAVANWVLVWFQSFSKRACSHLKRWKGLGAHYSFLTAIAWWTEWQGQLTRIKCPLLGFLGIHGFLGFLYSRVGLGNRIYHMVSPLYKSTSIIRNLDASCKPPFDLSLMVTRCQSFQVLWAKSKSKWQQAYKEREGETSYITEVAAQWVLGVRRPWMRQKFSWNLCRKQMRQRSWDKVRLVENNQEGSQMWTIWKNIWTMDFNFRYMRSQLKIEKA